MQSGRWPLVHTRAYDKNSAASKFPRSCLTPLLSERCKRERQTCGPLLVVAQLLWTEPWPQALHRRGQVWTCLKCRDYHSGLLHLLVWSVKKKKKIEVFILRQLQRLVGDSKPCFLCTLCICMGEEQACPFCQGDSCCWFWGFFFFHFCCLHVETH